MTSTSIDDHDAVSKMFVNIDVTHVAVEDDGASALLLLSEGTGIRVRISPEQQATYRITYVQPTHGLPIRALDFSTQHAYGWLYDGYPDVIEIRARCESRVFEPMTLLRISGHGSLHVRNVATFEMVIP